MGNVMTEQLKQFIQENRDLINENTKESWEEVYGELPKYDNLRGEFTQAILDAGINDPAIIMGHIPEQYLYNSNITNYKIPNNVESISSGAFRNCKQLISIEIPNGIKDIESISFAGCNSLTTITIPSSVATIDYNSFNGCSSLESIEIPNSIISIGEIAFCNCTSLKKLTIPNKRFKMGDSIFSNCPKLKEITFSGTKEEAIKHGIGNVKRKKWRDGSSIEKIICTDGVIEL